LYHTGNFLLSAIGVATAIGMSMPFISSFVFKKNVAIEEWLYHQVLSWAYIPLFLLIGTAPFVAWRTMTIKALLNRILNILTISVGLTGLCLFIFRNPNWGIAADATRTTLVAGKIEIGTVYWVAFLVFLSLFVAIANLWRLIETVKRAPMSVGGFLTHFGLAVFMAGMVMSRGLEKREQLQVQLSRPDQGLGYMVSLKANPKPENLFNRDNKVEFDVTGPDGKFIARPGLYYTESNDGPKPMVWPHIQRFGTHDVYMALGPPAMDYWNTGGEFFKPGETKTVKDVTVTFNGYEMVGEPGQSGTKFVGKVKVAYEKESFDVNPVFAIGDEPSMPIAGEFRVMMMRIDAATKGAQIQLFFAEAVYPIDLYYKPMTGLVWAGAGILTFGGLLAAFYRRPRSPKNLPIDGKDIGIDVEPEPIEENAPAPVA
jgi:cytochrome c-type biogenesis protein CcmF